MIRIATTHLSAELVLVSPRQLQLLTQIASTDIEVHLESPSLVIAASVDEGPAGPTFDRYYVRTAQALLRLGLICLRRHAETTYLVVSPNVTATLR